MQSARDSNGDVLDAKALQHRQADQERYGTSATPGYGAGAEPIPASLSRSMPAASMLTDDDELDRYDEQLKQASQPQPERAA